VFTRPKGVPDVVVEKLMTATINKVEALFEFSRHPVCALPLLSWYLVFRSHSDATLLQLLVVNHRACSVLCSILCAQDPQQCRNLQAHARSHGVLLWQLQRYVRQTISGLLHATFRHIQSSNSHSHLMRQTCILIATRTRCRCT
jgi:hypothetical protein